MIYHQAERHFASLERRPWGVAARGLDSSAWRSLKRSECEQDSAMMKEPIACLT